MSLIGRIEVSPEAWTKGPDHFQNIIKDTKQYQAEDTPSSLGNGNLEQRIILQKTNGTMY